jgi:hypothetical protein
VAVVEHASDDDFFAEHVTRSPIESEWPLWISGSPDLRISGSLDLKNKSLKRRLVHASGLWMARKGL